MQVKIGLKTCHSETFLPTDFELIRLRINVSLTSFNRVIAQITNQASMRSSLFGGGKLRYQNLDANQMRQSQWRSLTLPRRNLT